MILMLEKFISEIEMELHSPTTAVITSDGDGVKVEVVVVVMVVLADEESLV